MLAVRLDSPTHVRRPACAFLNICDIEPDRSAQAPTSKGIWMVSVFTRRLSIEESLVEGHCVIVFGCCSQGSDLGVFKVLEAGLRPESGINRNDRLEHLDRP